MDLCKAFKNKTSNLQCSSKIKTGNFCGTHRNYGTPIFDNSGNIINLIENFHTKEFNSTNNTTNLSDIMNSTLTVYKKLENSSMYKEYLNTRKNYIKDNNKHIDILEYMENSKLDFYPYARILASLEYYKLIKNNDNSKFMLVINNISILESFFVLLLKAITNIDKVIILQKWIKKSQSKFNLILHGPGFNNRKLCVNDNDFVSLDEITEIVDEDFISFKDENEFIYGFNLESIMELIFKSDENFYENFKKNTQRILCYRQYIRTLYNHYNKIKINNPYTRDLLTSDFKLKTIRLYTRKIYKKLGSNTNQIFFNNDNRGILVNNVSVDLKTQVRNKCFSIFQKIDMFGYMTDISWLMDENIKLLKLFYKKLAMQWNFEFGLNNTAKYKISGTHNLFHHIQDIQLSRADKYVLLDKILDTLNILVSNGQTDSDRNTGCIIILYALASINNRCIEANPWLA
jgi:hypothetical protein